MIGSTPESFAQTITELNKELQATKDKLKACEEERDRTVNGYAEEQLKLLRQITELEASHKQMIESAQINKRKLDNFDALEKIAEEGLNGRICICLDDLECGYCIDKKKIDELK